MPFLLLLLLLLLQTLLPPTLLLMLGCLRPHALLAQRCELTKRGHATQLHLSALLYDTQKHNRARL